jgi:hypothetical protein
MSVRCVTRIYIYASVHSLRSFVVSRAGKGYRCNTAAC